MRKDANEKYARKRNVEQARSGWVALICVLAILVCSSVFVLHEIKKSPETSAVAASYQHLMTWIAAHKKNINKEIVKVQQMAAKPEPEEIHFEFYTALPKMQIKTADLAVEEKPASTSKIHAAPKAVASNVYMGADELEREFSKHLKESNGYVIQLGTFQEMNVAERYRNKLLEDGFDVHVVSVALNNKEVYRVQAGPFTDKEEARFSQRQLQKKGLNGLLRKLS